MPIGQRMLLSEFIAKKRESEFIAKKREMEARKSKRDAKKSYLWTQKASKMTQDEKMDLIAVSVRTANQSTPVAISERFKAKRRTRSQRKRLVSELDALFSFYIRLRDKHIRGYCPFHMAEKKPIEHCFHFITRSKHILRWDTRNSVGSCAPCNLKMEHDTIFIDRVFTWYKNTFGNAAWDILKRDAGRIAKFSLADLETKRDHLKKMIADFKK